MKLFTINATPVHVSRDDATNDEFCKEYPADVARILSEHGMDGFTIYEVQGYWQGVAERSFKIEIAIDSDPERVYTVGKILRDKYGQDSVMLTLPNNSVKFI